MHTFFHDEDDVGMIQLHPIEWWDYCKSELEASATHAKAHEAPDGIGWTKMYQIGAPDSALPRLKMTEQRFIELLTPHGKRFDRIESPLAEVEAELGLRSVGFGPSRHCGIIADLDGDDVRSLWGRMDAGSADDHTMLTDMLTALAAERPMLLVDWREHQIVDLGRRDAIVEYLSR